MVYGWSLMDNGVLYSVRRIGPLERFNADGAAGYHVSASVGVLTCTDCNGSGLSGAGQEYNDPWLDDRRSGRTEYFSVMDIFALKESGLFNRFQGISETSSNAEINVILAGSTVSKDLYVGYIVCKSRCEERYHRYECGSCIDGLVYFYNSTERYLHRLPLIQDLPTGHGWQLWSTDLNPRPLSPICIHADVLKDWVSRDPSLNSEVAIIEIAKIPMFSVIQKD